MPNRLIKAEYFDGTTIGHAPPLQIESGVDTFVRLEAIPMEMVLPTADGAGGRIRIELHQGDHGQTDPLGPPGFTFAHWTQGPGVAPFRAIDVWTNLRKPSEQPKQGKWTLRILLDLGPGPGDGPKFNQDAIVRLALSVSSQGFGYRRDTIGTVQYYWKQGDLSAFDGLDLRLVADYA